MAKSRISTIIDQIIDDIEIQLNADNKHVIKLDTVKERALEFITIDCNNDDSQKCAEIGFDQIVHGRLYQYGYRSVRMGLFINLDSCSSNSFLYFCLDSVCHNITGAAETTFISNTITCCIYVRSHVIRIYADDIS